MRKTTTKTVKTNQSTTTSSDSKILNNFDFPTTVDDYILEIENFVDAQLCDDVVNEFKNSDEWDSTYIGHGSVDKNIRNADTIMMSTQPVIDKNYIARKKLDDRLFEVASKAIAAYTSKFKILRIDNDTGYQLLRYKKGQFYVQHTDSYKLHPRALSCSINLNDGYEGGEFAFFNRRLKYKGGKGSILLFPSSFMYPHEVMPVTKGTRYSIVTWFI